MICLHCGKEIPFGERVCKYCKQETEFETRFNYQPDDIPINKDTDNAYRYTDERNDEKMREILNKLGELSKRLESVATGDDLKKVIPMNAIISAVLLVIALVGGLFAVRSITKASQTETVALAKKVDALAAEQQETDEKLALLLEKEEALENKITASEKYSISFDLHLPDEFQDAGFATPASMNCYADDDGALYLPILANIQGYRFAGWMNPADGSVIPAGTTMTQKPTGNTVLYAVWESAIAPQQNKITSDTNNNTVVGDNYSDYTGKSNDSNSTDTWTTSMDEADGSAFAEGQL